MKQIIAYIKPHMLSKVAMALNNLEGLTGLSVTKVQGFGRSRAKGARQSDCRRSCGICTLIRKLRFSAGTN